MQSLQCSPGGSPDPSTCAGRWPELGLDALYKAQSRIKNRVLRTPLIQSPVLSAVAGTPVYLKLECQQITGSFKLRGAFNAICQLDPIDRGRGVVTASTGNHGRALAYAARFMGVPAVVCMSHLVPANKVDAVRAIGAQAHIAGQSQDDAQGEALRLSAQRGLTYLPPFDHPDVIAGQGTLGIEIVEQLPEVGTVVIPLSGGGLFSGVALGAKSINPSITAIGVTMEEGAAMHASLRAGHPVEVAELPGLADSLGGGIGLDNRYTFDMVRALADDTVLVSEAAIAQGMRHAYFEEREVLEGAAAVGIAALLNGQLHRADFQKPIVLILSGRNVDMRRHLAIISGQSAE